MSGILVFGGYGGFGARLVRRLAAAGHQVIVAGRSLDRAEAFCADVPGTRALVADRNHAAQAIADEQPELVIDAAGPFQDSGYDLPRACIAAGVPYLDLADGRSFVTGIGTLDAAARAAGVAVIAGASSVPALSGAAVRELAAAMERVTAIEMAISASNRATAGPSVAAAILSYVGRPFLVWRGQRWAVAHGWQDLGGEDFALSDGIVLGRRLVASADVPDLDLLPSRTPGRPSVRFRAGTELRFQMLALWLASWLVRWGLFRSLRRWAELLLPLQRLTGWLGGDRSGMVVRAFGFAAGRRVERRWTLIAEHGTGPDIPTLAAALLVERILAGRVKTGAGDAGTLLRLSDFDAVFDELGIRNEAREIAQPLPLYARVMGDRFDRLPAPVQAMHAVLRDDGADGEADVVRGSTGPARLVAAVMGFPPAGHHPLHVAFAERDGVERWTRDFGGYRFASVLSQRGGRLIERFGPLRFHFDLPSDERGLQMVLRRWSFAGILLPLILAPRSAAQEWAEGDRFHFDVPIALPLIGLVVHYTGWLEPKSATP